jgi:SagB-type dehydrogenase family enzyme
MSFRIIGYTGLILGICVTFACTQVKEVDGKRRKEVNKMIMKLPAPVLKGSLSVEEAINQRRSVRAYSSKRLNVQHIAQLLWSAQGITDKARGFRAVPSAGALYPLELYVIVGAVEGIEPGVYHYLCKQHLLELVKRGDMRQKLALSALGQKFIGEAPASIVITADYKRTEVKYGRRAKQYVHIEVGHAGQNLYLQAQSLGIATVVVGAFYDEMVAEVLDLPSNLTPLYIMPFGYPR